MNKNIAFCFVVSIIVSLSVGYQFGLSKQKTENVSSGTVNDKNIAAGENPHAITPGNAYYRVYYDWVSILDNGITPREEEASRHADVDHITAGLSQSKALRDRVVALFMTENNHTTQLFLRAVFGLSGEHKLEMAAPLIRKSNFNANEAAMMFMFNGSNPATIAAFVNDVLTSDIELAAQTHHRFLLFIANVTEFVVGDLIADTVLDRFQEEEDILLKAKYYRVLNPVVLDSDKHEQWLSSFLTSNNDEVVEVVLSSVLERQYHFPKLYGSRFLAQLVSLVEDISVDRARSLNTRTVALNCLYGFS